MTKQQALHVGMINSFNIITEQATFEQVLNSGIDVFAHAPHGNEVDYIKVMINYFEEHEMYYHCAALQKHIDETYLSDGTRKEKECECDFPEIKEYTTKMKCGACNKRLFR
jgi:hypothetical protein